MDPEAPARLYRSRADWPQELHLHPMEEIGSGPLAKMVRIALTDPDDAVWAYSIATADRSWTGREIIALRADLK